MPVLSADALDADPLGCEFLKAVLRPNAAAAHQAPTEQVPMRDSISREKHSTPPVACARTSQEAFGREQGRRAGMSTGGLRRASERGRAGATRA